MYKAIYQRVILQLSLFLSVIFDGMDQWKTYCPWLAGARNLLPNWRLKQKITGFYFHGMLLFFVITYAWTSSNADINLTGLHHALHIIHDKRLTKSDKGDMGPYWFV